MKRTATLAMTVAVTWSAAAMAEPPGWQHAGGARAQEVLREVQERVPEPARPAIERSRAAAGSPQGELLPPEAAAPGGEREDGRAVAEHNVRRGTSVSGEVLREVEGRVPEPARPAIGRSREASQTGARVAAEAVAGARTPAAPLWSGGHGARPSSGGESFGRPSFGAEGRPSFGGGSFGGAAPAGMMRGAGGPPAGIPGGRR